MGGKSSAQKNAERQAQQQNIENQRIQAENERRIKEQEAKNELLRKQQEYESDKQKRESESVKSAIQARDSIWDEKIKAFQDSKNLMTDFELQEKRRLLKAKQGTGQVDETDTAITGEDRQRAIDLMNKPDSYWQDKAQVAYDQAYQNAFDAYKLIEDPSNIPEPPANGNMGSIAGQAVLAGKTLMGLPLQGLINDAMLKQGKGGTVTSSGRGSYKGNMFNPKSRTSDQARQGAFNMFGAPMPNSGQTRNKTYGKPRK